MKRFHKHKKLKNEKVFDVFLFFNELDILELRLKMLNDVVDFFVITECDFYFFGKPKSLILQKISINLKNILIR